MKRFIAVILTVVFILSSITLTFADGDDEATVVAADEGVSLDGVEDTEYAFNFETVYENSEAMLLLDRSISAFRVVSKSTGRYYDTKVMNGQIGNELVRNNQKSDFSISHYTDMDAGNTRSFENYSQSIVFNQVEYEMIENGVRCSYVVGQADRVTLSMFPLFISRERFQELILDHLTAAQVREVLNDYYTETTTRYIRNWETYNRDGTLREIALPVLNRMYNYFYVLGNYTTEDLEYDNQEWGEETLDSNITFNVVMEYTLDGMDLIVNVPASEISVNSNKPESQKVYSISLNPYLLSGGVYDDGYLFVPDGSGAIIEFGSDNTYASVFSMPVYGSDILETPWFYSEQFVQTTLPVVGIKREDIAILGIIENAAEIATISANGAGRMDEFNKAFVEFELLHMESLPLTEGQIGTVMPTYANESYQGDITMRYILLEDDDANYVGMAKAYRDYLLDIDAIKQNPVSDDAPLFVDMIATVPIQKRFLGLIPYMSTADMTTFSQAQEILESLKQNGVKNIVAEYTAWTRGSFENDSLKNIRVINGIGGNKGLSNILSYASANDISFYPSANLLKVFNENTLSNSDITRYLNNQKASYPEFNIVTKLANFRYWLISPNFLRDYSRTVAGNMRKLNIENLSITDAGTLLYGDYNKNNQLMRSDVLDIYKESFDILNQDLNLMFNNANAYAFKYSSHITNLPTYDSKRLIIDYSIPFVQMVLENYVPYSMGAYNSEVIIDFDAYLLKAIETKSAIKLNLTYSDERAFNTASDLVSQYPYFRTQYSRWENIIGDYYNRYNEFYQRVKNAEIVSHKVINKDLVVVTYSNNVTVYINYSRETATVDGQSIPPLSYILAE